MGMTTSAKQRSPKQSRHLSFGPVCYGKLSRDLRLLGLLRSPYSGSAANARYTRNVSRHNFRSPVSRKTISGSKFGRDHVE